MDHTTTIDHHSALIYTMIVVAASDRDLRDAELRRIGDIVRGLPAFADFDENELPTVARQCAAMLADRDGLDTMLTVIDQALPARLKETAFALACEIAVIDHRLGREELRILELLREGLGLDRLVAAAIERGCRARHATA
ncbi:MAG: tellurite resistance TerB family protein [Alphaproteobacteria bacterium]